MWLNRNYFHVTYLKDVPNTGQYNNILGESWWGNEDQAITAISGSEPTLAGVEIPRGQAKPVRANGLFIKRLLWGAGQQETN